MPQLVKIARERALRQLAYGLDGLGFSTGLPDASADEAGRSLVILIQLRILNVRHSFLLQEHSTLLCVPGGMLDFDLERQIAKRHVREAGERVQRQKLLTDSLVPGSLEYGQADRVLDIMRVVLAELKDFSDFVESHGDAHVETEEMRD